MLCHANPTNRLSVSIALSAFHNVEDDKTMSLIGGFQRICDGESNPRRSVIVGVFYPTEILSFL